MTQIIITEKQSIATFNNVPASYENSFIYGVLSKAAESGISIDMIAQSPATSDRISFGFTFEDAVLPGLLAIINKQEGSDIQPLVNFGNVKITVKSQEMIDSAGFASKVFGVLKEIDCLPLLVTTGIDEISMLVGEGSKTDLERELRKAFAI
ncbi:MAG: aspartate kinase [Oscillospiraceae bacterium]|nr:aspartate kinase [Oscillospiraceae bacterium]